MKGKIFLKREFKIIIFKLRNRLILTFTWFTWHLMYLWWAWAVWPEAQTAQEAAERTAEAWSPSETKRHSLVLAAEKDEWEEAAMEAAVEAAETVEANCHYCCD